MRIVVALGGNALLQRGEALTPANQRRNTALAAASLAPLARDHELVVTHGNGPQVGLLALQDAALKQDVHYPLDVLDAESEGMIGYLIEQELSNLLPPGSRCATLLTQTEVAVDDAAFRAPSKPIGPVYDETEARALAAARGWAIARDGKHFRRVVASPRPRQILELGVIRLLVEQGVVVICAGGGGIPVVRRADGHLIGVEAVIDKDLASSLLARELEADALIMLTDVDAVYERWDSAEARAFSRIAADDLAGFEFAPGSMGPKVEAAREFVDSNGGFAAIGRLGDLGRILSGEAGTQIVRDAGEISYRQS